MSWVAQQGASVRLEWGPAAIEYLAAGVDCVVVVDVMSFSTCVDVAVARGASVFPYALLLGDIMIGSSAPIAFDPAVITERLAAVRDYYAAAGIDLMTLVHPYLIATPYRIGPGDARQTTDLNTDLFPRDEFSLPD